MNNPQFLHHYTSIDTLSVILKNRTVRFNRLDRVDDMSEAQAFGKYDLSKYIFVSCWTDSEIESIPQWQMYTNGMTGVRISLPRDLFDYRPLVPPDGWGFTTSGEILSPIPFHRMFTDQYLVLPNLMSKKEFERKVQYVDDLSSVYTNAVDLKIEPGGQAQLTINKTSDLATFKQRVWEFQSEFRFVLLVFPSLPLPARGFSDEQFLSKLPSHILNSILQGIGPAINHFDVDINPDVLDNVIITLGPLASEGDALVVEALLKQYTNSSKLLRSKLSGTIRKPMR